MATDFLRGVGMWISLTLDVAPGLILSFSQVMVTVALFTLLRNLPGPDSWLAPH